MEDFFSDSLSEAKEVYESLLTAFDNQLNENHLSVYDFDSVKSALNLTFIHYMNFLRRTESVRHARNLFARARKHPHCTYETFVASGNFHLFINTLFNLLYSSGLMEYYFCKEPNIAFKIFELGMEKYGCIFNYTYEYFNLLLNFNDENSKL